MAKVKRVIELSVEEKKFLDTFMGMIYDEFDNEDEEIGRIMADIYNLYFSDTRPLPMTYVGDLVEVRVVEEA